MTSNVPSWQQLFPEYSAFEIFETQLKGLKKSEAHFDQNQKVKKDLYLLQELTKAQELASLIQNNLSSITSVNNDLKAHYFLLHADQDKISDLQQDLEVYREIEKVLNKKIASVREGILTHIEAAPQSDFAAIVKFINDQRKQDKSKTGLETSLDLIRFYSNHIDSDEVANLEKSAQNKGVETTFEGADHLRLAILQDLKKKGHKLYYCSLDQSAIAPDEDGIASPTKQYFVIEKKDDKFRLYMTCDNYYSIESHLNSELDQFSSGLRSYKELYQFLQNLELLAQSKTWDQNAVNIYRQCFDLDRSDCLGRNLPAGSMKLTYRPIDVFESKFAAEWALAAKNQKYFVTTTAFWKSVGQGLFLGLKIAALLSTIAIAGQYASSYFQASNTKSK